MTFGRHFSCPLIGPSRKLSPTSYNPKYELVNTLPKHPRVWKRTWVLFWRVSLSYRLHWDQKCGCHLFILYPLIQTSHELVSRAWRIKDGLGCWSFLEVVHSFKNAFVNHKTLLVSQVIPKVFRQRRMSQWISKPLLFPHPSVLSSNSSRQNVSISNIAAYFSISAFCISLAIALHFMLII